MRNIHTIVFHCSASDNYTQDADSIRKYHKFVKGWSDIGYHYVIKKDGTIEDGRPIHKTGAHVRGANSGTVGVCFVGLNSFTPEQMESAHKIIDKIEGIVGKRLAIKGHNHYTKKKTCPNFDIKEFLQGNLKIIKKY